ncbi:MAG TPA: hypothetical protein VMH06_08585 [Thermodesulfovibrionales bacterium]|nr:hypothetical protein [Thermodesulfovibrionales bacterium]
MRYLTFFFLCIPLFAFASDMPQTVLDQQAEINRNILKEYQELASARHELKTQRQLSALDAQYRGRGSLPSDNKVPDAAREVRQCEERIADLERRKGNLKIDATKYYGGSLPASFLKSWDEEEQAHRERTAKYQ